jgi:hypothetical protein
MPARRRRVALGLDAASVAGRFLDHRRQRASQVLQWIKDGTLDVLVDRTYFARDADRANHLAVAVSAEHSACGEGHPTPTDRDQAHKEFQLTLLGTIGQTSG